MKRLIFPAVVLAFLTVLAPGARAGSPWTCTWPFSGCSVSVDEHYDRELLDILQTTHSVDSFVVTLNLLVETNVDPRTAIPLIVRNAERLGVFGNALQQEDDDKPSALVIEVLGKLKTRMRDGQKVTESPKERVEIPPWVEPRAEEKANRLTDSPGPIRASIPEGTTPICEEAPNEAVVLRALPAQRHCVPYCLEESRSDLEIVTERIVDKVDEPRFFPLVGLAQLHHCQWKCTIYYTKIVEAYYPFPYQMKHPRIEVVYIDKDHLHLYSPPGKKEPLYYSGDER